MGEIINLSPGSTKRLLESGEMQIDSTTEQRKRIEKAQELFGENFFGQKEVESALHITINPREIPAISFTEEELEHSADRGEHLILRVDRINKTTPLTINTLYNHLEPHFISVNVYDFIDDDHPDQSEPPPFFFKDSPVPRWALISDKLAKVTRGQSYLSQMKAVQSHLVSTIFKNTNNVDIPEAYTTALKEFSNEFYTLTLLINNARIDGIESDELKDKITSLKLHNLILPSAVDCMYDFLVHVLTKRKSLFDPNINILTSSFTPETNLVTMRSGDGISLPLVNIKSISISEPSHNMDLLNVASYISR